MGFRGSLESINLADIFQNLAMNQQTGTLTLTAEDRVRHVYFDKGEVKYVTSGRQKSELPLGQIALGRKLLEEERVTLAEAHAASSKTSIAQALVDLGMVGRDTLEEIVRYILQESVYDLFGWEKAIFEFNEGVPSEILFDTSVASEVRLATSNLIMEAARRIDEWGKIRKDIPSTSEIFVLKPEGLATPRAEGLIGPMEEILLELLDGTRDVDDIGRASWYSRFDVCQTILMLMQHSAVRSATPRELADAVNICRERLDLEGCVKLHERLLALDPENENIRRELAELCVSISRKDKAVIHLNALADRAHEAGDRAKSDALHRRILEHMPRHPPSRRRLAAYAEEGGKKVEAVEHYRALMEFHLEHDQFEPAREACERARAIVPRDADILQGLARSYLGLGKKDEALAELLRLGDLLAEQRETKRAAETYRRILSIDSSRADAKERLARVILTEDARRRRRGAFLTAGAIVLVVGLVAGAGYAREWWLLRSYQADDERAHGMAQKAGPDDADKLIEAARIYAPHIERFSLIYDVSTQARDARDKLTKRAEDIRERLGRERKEREDRERVRVQAIRDLRRAGELTRAIEEAAAFPQDTALIQTHAREVAQMLDEMRTEQRVTDEFLRRMKAGWSSREEERIHKLEFLKRYPFNREARTLRLPLEISSEPPGSTLTVSNIRTGGTKIVEGVATPVVVQYPPDSELEILLSRRGYQDARQLLPAAGIASAALSITLKRLTGDEGHLRDVGGLTTPFLAAGKRLYVGTQNAQLVAVDAAVLGRTLWERKLTRFGSVQGPPVIYKDRLYVCVGRFFQARTLDGEEIWSYAADHDFIGPAAIRSVDVMGHKDYAFLSSKDRHIHCVELGEGKSAWKSARHDTPIASPTTVTDRFVFAANHDMKLYAYRIANGQTAGAWGLGTAMEAAPVVGTTGHHLWAGGANGVLYKMSFDEPERGEFEKTLQTGAAIRSSGVVASPVSADATGGSKGCLFVSSEKAVWGVDMETGQAVWRSGDTLPGVLAGRPFVSARRVYVTTDQGIVAVFDRTSGKTVWRYQAEAGVAFNTGPVLHAGKLYAAGTMGTEGVLLAFEEDE